MRLIQFETTGGQRAVGLLDGDHVQELKGVITMRELALRAIRVGQDLTTYVNAIEKGGRHNYQVLLTEQRVLPPLDHEDPAHCIIAGTGLTHMGSAEARSQMHQKVQQADETLSDSMRMFKWGIAGGKPAIGEIGVQPEWFYKGDGSTVVRPGVPFPVPSFADDEGEEPEVVGLYVISDNGEPYRVGFAIGNECTDHVMEKKNYLYLAHAKLRYCSFGPELRVGDLPSHVTGTAKIIRKGTVIWERPFATGEDNMCHTLANIEQHHFKYNQFLRPGDVHVQFFGTSVASFADGIVTEDGDVFEIDIPEFGQPLINGTKRVPSRIGTRGVGVL